MHGLILWTVQHFVEDMCGASQWAATLKQANMPDLDIQPMFTYDDAVSETILDAVETACDRPHQELYEDLGTYLVTHPKNETVRRLLRFSGVSFEEFLFSLDDLPGRARLAVPDLELPDLKVTQRSEGKFDLRVGDALRGFGHVMVGIVRSIADDYGALVLVTHVGRGDGHQILDIGLLESEFSGGRKFDLAETSMLAQG